MRVTESPRRVVVENVRERSQMLVGDLDAVGTQIETWLEHEPEVGPAVAPDANGRD